MRTNTAYKLRSRVSSGSVRLIVVLLALALTAMSCGGGGSEEPGSQDTPGTGITPSDGSTQTEATDAANDPDAFLNVVSSIAPQQYDPIKSAFPCDVSELQLIYDTLIRREPDSTFSPGLASSWSAPNETTFELELQEGVQFQDGSNFDAEAVAAHFERALTSPLSALKTQLGFIDSVEVVDDLTVRLILSEPRVGMLPSLLSGVAGMVASPQAVESAGETYGSDGAVGAGPYEYVEHTPGEHLRVEAWNNYFDQDRQLLAGVEHFGISSQFQVQQIQNGELNYAALNENLVPDLRAAAEQGILEYLVDPSPQYMELLINFGAEPFDDVRVRQALNHAIDRDAFNQALTEGVGSVAWGPLPPNSPAKSSEVEEIYPYDPEEAQRLLAEAGYEDGLTIDAASIEIPLYSRAAQALQSMLAESNITLNLHPVTGGEINDVLYTSKQYDAGVTAFSSTDAGLMLEAKFSSEGTNNPAGTTAEGLDQLLADAAAEADQERRSEIYAEAELLVMEEALSVPIYHFAGVVAHAPELENVVKAYTACAGANYLTPPVYVAAE